MCTLQAVTLRDGRARISERCKGSGHCVAACPVEEIRLYVAHDADVLGGLLARIQQRTYSGSAVNKDPG